MQSEVLLKVHIVEVTCSLSVVHLSNNMHYSFPVIHYESVFILTIVSCLIISFSLCHRTGPHNLPDQG